MGLMNGKTKKYRSSAARREETDSPEGKAPEGGEKNVPKRQADMEKIPGASGYAGLCGIVWERGASINALAM